MSTVTNLNNNQLPHIDNFPNDIREVIYKRAEAGVISYAEVVGTLEILKHELLAEGGVYGL